MEFIASVIIHIILLSTLNYFIFSDVAKGFIPTIVISFISSFLYFANYRKYEKFSAYISALSYSILIFAILFRLFGQAVPYFEIISYLFLTFGVIAVIHNLFFQGYFQELANIQHREYLQTIHGTARFATKRDIPDLLLPIDLPLPNGCFILGPSWDEKEVIVLPRHVALQHGIILGGTGTGKSRGYFMPNCIANRNASYVATDPKSELWLYTSGFHCNSVRYAPTEPASSACFNWIPLCGNVRFAQLCARAIIEAGNSSHTEQFWIEAETSYLAAVFSHASTMGAPTPLTAYNLITSMDQKDLLKMLLNSPSRVARAQAGVFNQTNEKIKGAIVPAVAANLQFLLDDEIARFTSASLEPPNFANLRREPTGVYWCVREQDLARLRPLTSLFFTVALEQIAGSGIPDEQAQVPISLYLDEFANIGKIPDFDTVITLARGRGVSLWLGIQALSQLQARYGEAHDATILQNCSTKIALHGLDYNTATFISLCLGESTKLYDNITESSGTNADSVSVSIATQKRQLLTPDEVTRLGEDEALVRSGNRYPMRIPKTYYKGSPHSATVTMLGAALEERLLPAGETTEKPVYRKTKKQPAES